MDGWYLKDEYESIMNAIFEEFFDVENIKRTMGLFFNRVNNSFVECISTILTCLCTTAVNLNFTEHGFCPFKNEPFLLIPYDKMTAKQLKVIKQALCHCDASKNFLSCSQMGMGASIFMLENYNYERRLDTSLIMFGLYQLVKSSKNSIHSKLDVYSVMIQRLHKSVSISPESVLMARKLCLEHANVENM